MTTTDSHSDDDSETDVVQLGARVDKDLKELVKGLVRHKHDKIRGPLGRSYEKALKYYLAIHLVQNQDDLKAIAEKSDIEDKDRAIEKLRAAYDEVGPDLAGVAQVLGPDRQGENLTGGQPTTQSPRHQPSQQNRLVTNEELWEQFSGQDVLANEREIDDEFIDQVAKKVAEELDKDN